MMTSHTSKLFLLFIFTTFICLSSSSFIPTQYSIMGPNLDKLPTQDEAIQLFQQWKKEYGRDYKDLEEMARRFEIFLSNLKYITESNANRMSSSSYLLSLNKFADWSNEELKETYSHDLDAPTDIGMMPMLNVTHSAPSRFDWRSKGVVTRVKNQNPCGSCWAFSSTGAIEGINAIVTGQLISLSEQQLLDCTSGTCKGGHVYTSFQWVIKNGGIASENDYPYKAVKGTCRQAPKRVRIDNYGYISPGSDNDLRSALLQQPISVYFYVADDFYRYGPTSGVYDGSNCPRGTKQINHAMLIVGYDSVNGVDYWIVKNQWGTGWGINGYAWIKRNTGKPYGVCAINAYVFYPIKSRRLISDV